MELGWFFSISHSRLTNASSELRKLVRAGRFTVNLVYVHAAATEQAASSEWPLNGNDWPGLINRIKSVRQNILEYLEKLAADPNNPVGHIALTLSQSC